jgi:hypothetical protein
LADHDKTLEHLFLRLTSDNGQPRVELTGDAIGSATLDATPPELKTDTPRATSEADSTK